jgi:hypothetical protein
MLFANLRPQERVILAKRAVGFATPPAWLDDDVMKTARQLGFFDVVAPKRIAGEMIATDGQGNLIALEISDAGRHFLRGDLS